MDVVSQSTLSLFSLSLSLSLSFSPISLSLSPLSFSPLSLSQALDLRRGYVAPDLVRPDRLSLCLSVSSVSQCCREMRFIETKPKILNKKGFVLSA